LVFALALSLLMLAGLMFLGLRNNRPAVVEAPAKPAVVARLVEATGAQWDPAFAPTGNDLTAAQRLKLQSGTAEITFSTGARVVLEAPADFTVGRADAKSEIRNPKSEISNSCFLALGKLTANVPQSAKGFTVETPTGRATDLGTQFGVFVRSEVGGHRGAAVVGKSDGKEPTSDLRLPTSTEVHVFQGQVEVADSESPKSEIPNRGTRDSGSSEILSSGQAASITPSGIQPLPAADPFKFALDQLDGRSRQTVLTDDFESLGVGDSGRSIGQWTTAYASPEQLHVIDPRAGATGVPPALPPVGERAIQFSNERRVAKHLHPLLSYTLDGRQFPARCQLLVECDISPRTPVIEPSIQLSGDFPLRFAPGIALSRQPDLARPKLTWQKDQWYRIRAIWDVADGAPQGATVERLQWHGADGWIRDTTVRLPAPNAKLDPVGAIWFGFPAPLAGKAGGTYWLDNVRVEVISEN